MRPAPTTDATAALGKRSDTIVNRFAAHAIWAAAASPISHTAACELSTAGSQMTGIAQALEIPSAVFLATLSEYPFRRRIDEIHPPPMPPAIAQRKIITIGVPIAPSGTPNIWKRNLGVQ